MKIIYSLITMLMLSTSTLNADVIIGDAAFYDDWQLGIMLITWNITGGLSVDVNNLGGGSYEFSTGLIGPDYRLYSATSGLEFTSSQTGEWDVLVPGTSIETFSLNETIYYAYWEDVVGTPDEPDNADNYGWARLTYTSSGLEISDSATALGGGIIVGTYTQIPEPATVLLFGLGGFGVWLLRRNKQHQDELE